MNVYAGLAGFYLLRGGPDALPAGVLPGPAPRLGDPKGTRYYEIPLAIQDRSFNRDGSLFYPRSRRFFDDFAGPYRPDSDVPPIWNPEFFGNTIIVNGKVWPNLDVDRGQYRFILYGGSNARFYNLSLDVINPSNKHKEILPLVQIASDGGYLPKPVTLNNLTLAPGEGAIVLLDVLPG